MHENPFDTAPNYFISEQLDAMDASPLSGDSLSTDGTSSTQGNPSDTASFVCDDCGNTYPKRHLLNKHYRIHKPPLECPHDACDKKLPQRKELGRHILSHHRSWAKKQPEFAYLFTKVYRCENCAYATDRPDNLKRHVDKATCQKTGK